MVIQTLNKMYYVCTDCVLSYNNQQRFKGVTHTNVLFFKIVYLEQQLIYRTGQPIRYNMLFNV